MKIALLEPIGVSKEVIDELSAPITEKGHEFVYYDTKTTDPAELAKRSEGCDIVMIANNPYPTEVVEKADALKMLSVAFTGIDHIGTDKCKEKNIMICNAAGYSNQTVAELIIGMAIDALRHVVKADGLVRNGGTSAGLGGKEICGRTVGIIGLGQIGLMAAKLFQAFGAKVIAYNRSESEEAKALGIEYKSLEEVLSTSDIVSLNLPLNAETRGFLSADKIAKALNDGKLGYACVDVFDMEPPIPADYPLLQAKNTLLTPHQAFISEESMVRRAKIVFDNVTAYLDGKPVNVCKL